MNNTIVIWKNITSDPRNKGNLQKRMLVIYPRTSKSPKLLGGLTMIEKNMEIDKLAEGERLPIKISKDKKGLIIRDKYFVYLFIGNKEKLEHKERVMNQVLKKCSMTFKAKDAISCNMNPASLRKFYEEVESIYQSNTNFIFKKTYLLDLYLKIYVCVNLNILI